MSEKAPKKLTLSLSYKILIPLIALVTAIFILSYFGLQKYLRETIYGILDEETSAIMDYAGECLDGDVLKSLVEDGAEYDEEADWPDGMTDERYWEQQSCLDTIYQFNPRTEIYTYYREEDGSLAFGLDQWATIDPEDSFSFGMPIVAEDTDYDKLLLGLEGIYRYESLKYDAEYDVYYYATIVPIEDSSGETVGGLVIYLDANWVAESLQELSNTLLSFFAVIYVLVILIVLFITRSTTRQLAELKAAASRVADGDYTPIAFKPQAVSDEVSSLAALFNIMLDKVRGREESLKQEVVELRIQIDEQKRKKAVNEIVDTEFFQELHSRATQMRKRTQKK